MSCYSINHRLAFIHIPKNGGTAVRRALRKACPDLRDFDEIDKVHRSDRDAALANHFPIWKIQRLLRETNSDVPFDTFRTFMVVRDPWDRMLSLYRHRLRKLHLSYEGKPRNTEEDIRVAERGFMSWLLTTPSAGDSVLTKMSQATWGKNEDEQYCVHRVLRQESLSADWLDLVEDWGLPAAGLGRHNVGDGKYDRSEYNEATRAHVALYFNEDLVRYGYRF